MLHTTRRGGVVSYLRICRRARVVLGPTTACAKLGPVETQRAGWFRRDSSGVVVMRIKVTENSLLRSEGPELYVTRVGALVRPINRPPQGTDVMSPTVAGHDTRTQLRVTTRSPSRVVVAEVIRQGPLSSLRNETGVHAGRFKQPHVVASFLPSS